MYVWLQRLQLEMFEIWLIDFFLQVTKLKKNKLSKDPAREL